MRGATSTPKPSATTAAPPVTTSSDGSATADDRTPAPTKKSPSASKASTPTPSSTARSIPSGSRASSSYPYAGSSSRASSSSASYSYDPDTVGNDPGWTKDFPCQFYPPDADGCAEYRSCYDCLNSGVVYKGRGCYVNSLGRCLPLAAPTFSKTETDFRKGNASNNATKPVLGVPSKPAFHYFPSRAAKYCAMSDPVCQKCRRTVFQNVIEYESTDGLSNFCYGHNNCVCIAVCEAPSRADVLGGLMCNGKPLPGRSGSSNQASSQANRSGLNVDANIPWLIGVPMVGLVMAVMLVSWSRKHRLRRELPRDVSLFGDRPFSSSLSGLSDSSVSRSSRSSSSVSSVDEHELGPPQTAGGDPSRALRLPGWRALRNELIEREQQLIAGRQDFSSIGYVQLLDTSSTTSAASVSEDGRESDDETAASGRVRRHEGASRPYAVDAQTLAASQSEEEEEDDDEGEEGADGAIRTIDVRYHRSSSRNSSVADPDLGVL